MAALAGGAEAVIVPEIDTSPELLAHQLHMARSRGKSHAIVVVAEGARNNAEALAQYFREHSGRLGFELRVTRLGHVQRGGGPGVYDRVLATRLGTAAIERLHDGQRDVLVGLHGGEIGTTPLAEVAGHRKPLDLRLIDLAKALAM